MRHDRIVDGYEEDPFNQLTARFDADGDGTGKLWIRASAGGFSGESAGWFNTRTLFDFASALAAYPLPDSDPPHIETGFGKPGELEQELLSVAVKPVGGRGQIGVQVHLRTEWWPDTRPDSIMDVRLELLTTYERMRLFSGHFVRMVQGEFASAVLGGETLM
jgi:hypothetical protein